MYKLYSRYTDIPVGGVGSVHLWSGGSILGIDGCPMGEYRRDREVATKTQEILISSASI